MIYNQRAVVAVPGLIPEHCKFTTMQKACQWGLQGSFNVAGQYFCEKKVRCTHRLLVNN